VAEHRWISPSDYSMRLKYWPKHQDYMERLVEAAAKIKSNGGYYTHRGEVQTLHGTESQYQCIKAL
jgi:hypothetical protein